MKTEYDFVNSFPEPYRSQAIDNILDQGYAYKLEAEIYGDDQCLHGLFRFKNTPQGHDYWWDFGHSYFPENTQAVV